MLLDSSSPQQSIEAQAAHGGMTALAAYWRDLCALEEPLRDAAHGEIRRKARLTSRASRIHDHWVSLALREFPTTNSETHQELLQNGLERPPETWLEWRAVNWFPLGPVHLSVKDEKQGSGHFALLEVPHLIALLDDLGLAGLVIATSDAPPRRQAAVALSLEESERHLYSLMRVRFSPEMCARMKLRMQSVLIGSGTRGVEHALIGMGADLMALGLSRRFSSELRFMIHKLPLSRGEVLSRAMSSMARKRSHWEWGERALSEALKIRALVRA